MKDDATLHEAKLRETAQRLGARAAEQLDVDRTAQAVVARLRERPHATAWSWVALQPAWLRIAALLVLAVGAGVLTRSVQPVRPPRAPAEVPLEDLGGLTADQLRAAITSLDQPFGEEVGGGGGGADGELEGLSAEELRALLRTLEG